MATLAQKLAKRGGDYISARTTLALPVTAVTNTDFIVTVPANAIDLNFTVFTTTAYTAVTDAQISIGSTVGGVDYVAAVTIKAVAIQLLTRVNAAAAALLNAGASGLTLNVRVAQSGGSTAVGNATLVCTYGLPVS